MLRRTATEGFPQPIDPRSPFKSSSTTSHSTVSGDPHAPHLLPFPPPSLQRPSPHELLGPSPNSTVQGGASPGITRVSPRSLSLISPSVTTPTSVKSVGASPKTPKGQRLPVTIAHYTTGRQPISPSITPPSPSTRAAQRSKSMDSFPRNPVTDVRPRPVAVDITPPIPTRMSRDSHPPTSSTRRSHSVGSSADQLGSHAHTSPSTVKITSESSSHHLLPKYPEPPAPSPVHEMQTTAHPLPPSITTRELPAATDKPGHRSTEPTAVPKATSPDILLNQDTSLVPTSIPSTPSPRHVHPPHATSPGTRYASYYPECYMACSPRPSMTPPKTFASSPTSGTPLQVDGQHHVPELTSAMLSQITDHEIRGKFLKIQQLLALSECHAAPIVPPVEVNEEWADNQVSSSTTQLSTFGSKIGDGCAVPGRKKYPFFTGPYEPPVPDVRTWIEELHTKDIMIRDNQCVRFPPMALKRMLMKAAVRWTGQGFDPTLWNNRNSARATSKKQDELRRHWEMKMFLSLHGVADQFKEQDFLSIYAYSYQIPEKEDNPHGLQIYGVANQVMRTLGEAQPMNMQHQHHEGTLEVFRPFIFWLDIALRHLPSPSPTFVYRGLSVRIDKKRHYRIGEQVTWHSFSSTTSDRRVTNEFSEAGGTCFLVHVSTAQPIEVFSAFPNEKELLLGSNATFEVMNVISDTHLQMMESKLDLIVLREVTANSKDDSSALRFKVQAANELSSLYKNLWNQYVPPKGRPSPSSSRAEEYDLGPWLLKQVEQCQSLVVITAQAGAGKTTVALWLMHHLLEQQAMEEEEKRKREEDQIQKEEESKDVEVVEGEPDVPLPSTKKPILPLFLSLPGVGAEVFGRMGLMTSLQMQYALTTNHILELFASYKVVLVLDSFDEISTELQEKAEAEHATDFLASNGLDLWHDMTVLVTCREEFRKLPEWLTKNKVQFELTNIVPFNTDQVDQYLRQRAELDMSNVCTLIDRRAALHKELKDLQIAIAHARPEHTALKPKLEQSLRCTEAQVLKTTEAPYVRHGEKAQRTAMADSAYNSWKDAIRKTHGLQPMLSNPFLLWLVLPSLTELQFQADSAESQGYPILQYTVCERSMERFLLKSLHREEPELFKVAKIPDNRSPAARAEQLLCNFLRREQRVQEGMNFAMGLAIWMFAHNLSNARVGDYLDVNAIAPSDKAAAVLFRCMPLRMEAFQNSANFSFRHRMLMEFLVARYLWEDTAGALRILNDTNRTLRVTDRPLLKFFGQRLQREETLNLDSWQHRVKLLKEIVKDTSRPVSASVALSLLVAGMVPLAGADLRGVKVPHAILTGAVLAGANLQGADLSKAVLCNAVLDYADVEGANFEGVDISEHSPMECEEDVTCVACHPKRSKVFAVAHGHTVRIGKRTDTGVLTTMTLTTQRPVTTVCFSIKKMIAVGLTDRTVLLWDINDREASLTQQMRHHDDHLPPKRAKKGIKALAFSSDGLLVASCTAASIQTCDLTGHTIHNMTPVSTKELTSVAFFPSPVPEKSKNLVSGGTDGFVRLWRDGRQVRAMKRQSSVCSVTFSPDGTQVIAGYEDCDIIMWDLQGHIQHTLSKHHEAVVSLQVCPTTNTLVSGSCDGTIRMWTLTGQPRQVLKGIPGDVTSLSVNSNGSQLICGIDNLVYFYDIGEFETSDKSHNGSIMSVAVSPGGELIATAADAVRLWSITGELLTTIAPPDYEEQSCVAFGSRGSRHTGPSPAHGPPHSTLIIGCTDGSIATWTLTGTLIELYEGHEGAVTSITASPSGQLLASTAFNDVAYIWRDNGISYPLQGGKHRIMGVVFCTDDMMAGAMGPDVIMWSTKNGAKVRQLGSHTGSVLSLKVSDDRQLMATCDKKEVKLWSNDGTHVGTIAIDLPQNSEGEEEDEEDDEPEHRSEPTADNEDDDNEWWSPIFKNPSIGLCEQCGVLICVPQGGLLLLSLDGQQVKKERVGFADVLRAEAFAVKRETSDVITVVTASSDGTLKTSFVTWEYPWVATRCYPESESFSCARLQGLMTIKADEDFKGVLAEAQKDT